MGFCDAGFCGRSHRSLKKTAVLQLFDLGGVFFEWIFDEVGKSGNTCAMMYILKSLVKFPCM